MLLAALSNCKVTPYKKRVNSLTVVVEVKGDGQKNMSFSFQQSRVNPKQKEARVLPSENKKMADMPANECMNIKVTRKAYAVVFGLILVPYFLVGGFALGRINWSATWNFFRPTATASHENSPLLNPGPWGTMEYVPFYIEIPEEYLSVRLDEKSDHRWFFKNFSREKLNQFLGAVSLTASEKQQVLESSSWQTVSNGVYVTPSREVILSMTPQARSEIYSRLAQFPENIWQREDAFSFPADAINDFFAKSGVSPEIIAAVKKLCWPRGKLLMFSDLPSVLEMLPAPKEKLRLEKVLSRRPTLLLKLRVTPDSDLGSLVNYWGRAGQEKDLKPLLEGLAKLPQGAIIDVMHLLPPMPTARIYTYPFPSFNQPENCHWTSFNFFRDSPDARFTDVKFIRQKIDADYYPVFSDPRYGDLVFLTNPAGEIIHSAVYMADNVVYTKNGGHFSAPWLLMRLSNLVETYSTFVAADQQVKVLYYRNKYY